MDERVIADHVELSIFAHLYQVDPPPVSLNASHVATPMPDPPSTLTEVREAISKMGGTAAAI